MFISGEETRPWNIVVDNVGPWNPKG